MIDPIFRGNVFVKPYNFSIRTFWIWNQIWNHFRGSWDILLQTYPIFYRFFDISGTNDQPGKTRFSQNGTLNV